MARHGYKAYHQAVERLAPMVEYQKPIAFDLGWNICTIEMEDLENRALSITLVNANKQVFTDVVMSPGKLIRQVEWTTEGLFDLAEFYLSFSRGYKVKRFGSYYRLEHELENRLFETYTDLIEYASHKNYKPSKLEVQHVRPCKNKKAALQLFCECEDGEASILDTDSCRMQS